MAFREDKIDWSQYPKDRVEGLKFFYCKNPSSDEDGPCTEEELKMLCLKWDCKVDMRIDNFLYWLMKKTKERDFKGNDGKFKRKIPLLFDNLRTSGLRKYQKYQEDFAEDNRQYMQRSADWRKNELRRLRYLEKLALLCANWTWSSDEEDADSSDSEVELSDSKNVEDVETDGSVFNYSLDSSIITVVNTQSQSIARYNSYLETESEDIRAYTASQGEADRIDNKQASILENVDVNVSLDTVTSQSFLPHTTSTQK